MDPFTEHAERIKRINDERHARLEQEDIDHSLVESYYLLLEENARLTEELNSARETIRKNKRVEE